jgi:hypothetical protein
MASGRNILGGSTVLNVRSYSTSTERRSALFFQYSENDLDVLSWNEGRDEWCIQTLRPSKGIEECLSEGTVDLAPNTGAKKIVATIGVSGTKLKIRSATPGISLNHIAVEVRTFMTKHLDGSVRSETMTLTAYRGASEKMGQFTLFTNLDVLTKSRALSSDPFKQNADLFSKEELLKKGDCREIETSKNRTYE